MKPMTPTTYLTHSDLAALRRRLADEIIDRRADKNVPVDFTQYASDTAGDVCRPDMGGAYLGNVQSRADARGLRTELDAVVERMAL